MSSNKLRGVIAWDLWRFALNLTNAKVKHQIHGARRCHCICRDFQRSSLFRLCLRAKWCSHLTGIRITWQELNSMESHNTVRNKSLKQILRKLETRSKGSLMTNKGLKVFKSWNLSSQSRIYSQDILKLVWAFKQHMSMGSFWFFALISS